MRVIAAQFLVLTLSTTLANAATLERGTPVVLTPIDKFSSKTSAVGTKIHFRTAEAVKCNDGSVAIEKHSPTTGYVTSVSQAKGKDAGEIVIHVDSVKTINGQDVPLNFDFDLRGPDGQTNGAMIAGALTRGAIGSNWLQSCNGGEAINVFYLGKIPLLKKNAATQADVNLDSNSVALKQINSL